MKITSVEKHKKNKDRLVVYVDGQFAFIISEDDYLSMNLYDKQDITQEEIERARNEIGFRNAKSLAVKYLSLKIRSEKEVEKKLTSDGFEPQVIASVIEELKALGYINDRLYVQKYIFDRSKLKPVSKRMLKFELQGKGIAAEDIDEVLSDWKLDEKSLAESLIKKKFGKYDLQDEKIRKRAFSFLHHRGFDFELINEVLEKMNS